MAPDANLIDRACRLYSAGASAEDFAHNFGGETDHEGLWLLWHAARAAHAIDERHPFTFQRKFTTNGIAVIVR